MIDAAQIARLFHGGRQPAKWVPTSSDGKRQSFARVHHPAEDGALQAVPSPAAKSATGAVMARTGGCFPIAVDALGLAVDIGPSPLRIIFAMSEIELKLGVPEGSLAAVESALRRLGARSRPIESHYWDSADRRLAKAGLSLRLRKSAGRWEQTVKAAGASPVERLEETVSRPGRWDAGGPPPELWMFAGTAAGRLVDAALARRHGHAPALERVHSSLIGRRAARIEVGGADIEIALDRGALVAGDRSLPVCEFEAELKHGDVAALVDFAHGSVDAHGMWLSTIAKSTRGERLSGRADERRAVKARPARLRGSASGEEIFRAVMRSCLEQVLANASVLAEGEIDDEVVHQLRVGIRRMRTAWRELGEWRGPLAAEWEAPAADVFRALGDYRDRQTVAASMQPLLAAAGSPDPVLQPPGPSTSVDPVALARARPFQHALLDALPQGARARRCGKPLLARRVAPALTRRIRSMPRARG